MSYNLIFLPFVEDEITDTAIWYENKQRGLGGDFIDELKYCYTLLIDNPEIAQESYKTIRRLVLKKFPYYILYAIENQNIVIIGVVHVRRNPKKIYQRYLKPNLNLI